MYENKNDGAHFIYYQDSSHINNWYEWWYFNAKNDDKAIIVYFFTFGNLNNPFTSTVGVFASFFNNGEVVESIVSYPFIDYTLDYEKCNITVGKNSVYEEKGIYYIQFQSPNLKIYATMYGRGMPFGGKPQILKDWQWMAWYVPVPYGYANVTIFAGNEKYGFNGRAYHDHNWGMGKFANIKWDWGEFSCKNFSIIYGIANGIGGLYFVNHSNVTKYRVNLVYKKWFFKNGFVKPSIIKIYSDNNRINLTINLEKCYVIGKRNFGKPYMFGRMTGTFYNKKINTTGFYEHHGIMFFNKQ